MERKLKPIFVERILREKGIRLFGPQEFRRVFGVTLRAAQEFIKDHQHEIFVKLRNGLYALSAEPPHELEIANRLYAPSYVSLEYALAFHRLIPETVYTVTSVTTRITRSFTAQDKQYEYCKIKSGAYAGYRLIAAGSARFLMAVPEKALVDYCYFMHLRLKPMNDRLRVKSLDGRAALRYARLFGREPLVRLVQSLW